MTKPDPTLVAASRCEVQQHVLGGLLHDLNGPLNNITLTLALISATVTRQVAANADDPLVQRLVRHVATLEAEARRLAACSQAMSSILHAEHEEPEPLVLHALATEVRRQLRHHAALHDVAIDVAAAGDGAVVRAGRDALQFALLATVLALSALCAPGGAVMLDTFTRGDSAVLRISAKPATLPDGAREAFDSTMVSPPSKWLHLVAGRAVAVAEGGTATLALRAPDDVVVEIAFDLHR